VPKVQLPALQAPDHAEFKVNPYEEEFTNRFTTQAEELTKYLEEHQAELDTFNNESIKFAQKFPSFEASEEMKRKEGETPFCKAMDAEVDALKQFIITKEATKKEYIAKTVAQKREEHKQRSVDAATAHVKAMTEKQSMLQGLTEQTNADHKARAGLSENIRGELDRYIKQDATRAQADLENAANHAADAVNAVDTKHNNLHSGLKESHSALSDKHDAFEGEIKGHVAEIDNKLQKNEDDKAQRHVETLKTANDFTTEVKQELNHKADSLEKMHKALRTDHDNLGEVVGTHTNNLGVTRKYILDQFGRKASWDSACNRTFGNWPKPQARKTDDVQSVVSASDNSTNGSDDKKRRRLATDSVPLTPSERALARRRLMNRPKSHTVVLEALLEEINRLN